MWRPRRPLMTQVQHWTKTAQTNHVTLRPWPLTLEVMAPVADAGRRPPSVHPVWSLQAMPFGRYGTRCVWTLLGLVTLTFDLLILKLVRESHRRWGTFLPNLGTLGLELFAMYATDGRTDGQTDGWTDGQTKAMLIIKSNQIKKWIYIARLQ